MPKKYIFALVVFLIVLGSPTLSLPMKDIQATTSCKEFDCLSIVDLKGIGLTTIQTDSIKSMNLNNYLPKLEITKGLKSIAYNITGNILYIYGTIKENTYWTMDLGSYVTLDPWWNYTINGTNNTITVGINTFGGADANKQGYVIKAKANSQLVSVTKHGSDQTTKAYLYTYPDGSLIASATFSGTTATFSPYPNLVNQTTYFIVGWSDGASRNEYIKTGSVTPITSGRDINISNATYYDGTWHYDALGRVIDNITTLNFTSASIYYETFLYLNGNQTNITLDNQTALNISASTNLTGLNVSLYLNGVLKNNTITSSTYRINLSEGLYNVTAYFFNASVNSSLTWWANMTFDSSLIPSGDSSIIWDIASLEPNEIYCSDADTLTKVYSDANITRNIICSNGCENNACRIDETIGFIIAIILILVVIFIGYKVLK
jgi:hypothetical protein